MVRAFILIDAAVGTADQVCRAAREAEGVREAHVVAGDFDVIVELEGETPHETLTTVTGAIRPIEGVGTTRTYVCLE